jgi:hypothetical protein
MPKPELPIPEKGPDKSEMAKDEWIEAMVKIE